MTCKDCYHYSCHKYWYNGFEDFDSLFNLTNVDIICPEFKDKSKILELPCKVGDTVYHILGLNEEKIKKAKVTNLEYNLKYNEWIVFFDYLDGVLGKTVFLTREEAEQKLEELEK